MMLEVELKSRSARFGLVFSHHTEVDKHAKKKLVEDKATGLFKKEAQRVRHTECVIVEILQNGSLVEKCKGTSTSVPFNRFNKERGRKDALRRALCQHMFAAGRPDNCRKCGLKFTFWKVFRTTPDERRVIWDAYRGRPRLAETPKKIVEAKEVTALVLRTPGPARELSISGRGMLPHDDNRGAEAAPI